MTRSALLGSAAVRPPAVAGRAREIRAFAFAVGRASGMRQFRRRAPRVGRELGKSPARPTPARLPMSNAASRTEMPRGAARQSKTVRGSERPRSHPTPDRPGWIVHPGGNRGPKMSDDVRSFVGHARPCTHGGRAVRLDAASAAIATHMHPPSGKSTKGPGTTGAVAKPVRKQGS